MIKVYGIPIQTSKRILTPPLNKEVALYIKAVKDGKGLALKNVKGLK